MNKTERDMVDRVKEIAKDLFEHSHCEMDRYDIQYKACLEIATTIVIAANSTNNSGKDNDGTN